MKLDRVILDLIAARDVVVAQLRDESKHGRESQAILSHKFELDRAIGCLQLCERYGIQPGAAVIVLPEKNTTTPLSEYRVVEDCETDDRAGWIEVEVEGSPVRPIPGALIVERAATRPPGVS